MWKQIESYLFHVSLIISSFTTSELSSRFSIELSRCNHVVLNPRAKKKVDRVSISLTQGGFSRTGLLRRLRKRVLTKVSLITLQLTVAAVFFRFHALLVAVNRSEWRESNVGAAL